MPLHGARSASVHARALQRCADPRSHRRGRGPRAAAVRCAKGMSRSRARAGSPTSERRHAPPDSYSVSCAPAALRAQPGRAAQAGTGRARGASLARPSRRRGRLGRSHRDQPWQGAARTTARGEPCRALARPPPQGVRRTSLPAVQFRSGDALGATTCCSTSRSVAIERAFADAGIPHAFGGAQALGYYVQPSAHTHDIDVNVLPRRGRQSASSALGTRSAAPRATRRARETARSQPRTGAGPRLLGRDPDRPVLRLRPAAPELAGTPPAGGLLRRPYPHPLSRRPDHLQGYVQPGEGLVETSPASSTRATSRSTTTTFAAGCKGSTVPMACGSRVSRKLIRSARAGPREIVAPLAAPSAGDSAGPARAGAGAARSGGCPSWAAARAKSSWKSTSGFALTSISQGRPSASIRKSMRANPDRRSTRHARRARLAICLRGAARQPARGTRAHRARAAVTEVPLDALGHDPRRAVGDAVEVGLPERQAVRAAVAEQTHRDLAPVDIALGDRVVAAVAVHPGDAPLERRRAVHDRRAPDPVRAALVDRLHDQRKAEAVRRAPAAAAPERRERRNRQAVPREQLLRDRLVAREHERLRSCSPCSARRAPRARPPRAARSRPSRAARSAG